MKNILFVCTGNTCRSPMAEGLFRMKVGSNDPWKCSSAGTHAINGLPASLESQLSINKKGGNIKNHKSRLLNEEILSNSDLILVMTEGHRKFIKENFSNVGKRVYLINELGTSKIKDVGDPYGKSFEIYDYACDEIEYAIDQLLIFLRLGEK